MGKQIAIDLPHQEVEVYEGGPRRPVRAYSSTEWRRSGYSPTNAEAYRTFKALCERSAEPSLEGRFTYHGIPLVQLFQRHLTEALGNRLRQVHNLQPVLTAEKPMAVTVPDELSAKVVRLAAQQVAQRPKIKVDRRTSLRRSPLWHLGLSLARSALYAPRIGRLRLQIPSSLDVQAPILFHPFSPNHLPTFLPLIERLKNLRRQVIVAGADTNTLRRGDVDPSPLAPLGIPYIPFEGAITGRELVQAMTRATWTAARLGLLVRQPPFCRGSALEANMADLAQMILAELLERQLPKILLYIDMADALYRHIQPSAVIVADETLPVLGRIALRTAQREGIPTLTIQHGLLLDDPMYYGPVVADMLAVWGEHSRDFLVAHGCPPAKLVTTGSTRFGQPPDDLSPLNLAALLGVAPGTRVILFMAQPGGRDVSVAANKATLVALARAVAQLPDCYLLVKLHPVQQERELADLQETLAATVPDAPVSFRRALPLHEAMLGASLCATVFSTTGLEALWLDRPLLTINLTDRPDMIPYAKTGAAVAAYDEEAVLPQLQQALNPVDQTNRAAARRRFVARYLGPLDGLAAERLVSLIFELAEGSSG